MSPLIKFYLEEIKQARQRNPKKRKISNEAASPRQPVSLRLTSCAAIPCLTFLLGQGVEDVCGFEPAPSCDSDSEAHHPHLIKVVGIGSNGEPNSHLLYLINLAYVFALLPLIIL